MKFITSLLMGLSRMLNTVMTTILLTIVFFCIVTPVALLRRLAGADPLRRKQFKKGRGSALVTRNQTYTEHDLKNLF